MQHFLFQLNPANQKFRAVFVTDVKLTQILSTIGYVCVQRLQNFVFAFLEVMSPKSRGNSTDELDEDNGLFNPTTFRNKLTFGLEPLSHPG